MAYTDTSTPALAAEGTKLQIGDGSSPQNWDTIANVGDINGPAWSSTEVDVTSHSSQAPFRRRIVTLLDIGPVTAKIFWVPQNPTHGNNPTTDPISGNIVGGLRYLYLNRLKRQFRLLYTDGTSSDVISAYVSKLGEVLPVAGVNEMTITLSGTDYPISMV